MPIKFKILILFLWLSFTGLAQNPHPYFRNYTTDDGLPSSEVHYCIQDNNGYMWFATDNGVSRFDGYAFTNFGPREGLKHNVVFHMQRDKEGRIWLATMHGHLYYIEKDSIHAFAQNGAIEQINQNSEFVTDFFIDSLDVKYLSVKTKGIIQFLPDGSHQIISPSAQTIPRVGLIIQNRWITGNWDVPDSIQELNLKKNAEGETYFPLEVLADPNYLIENMYFQKSKTGSSFWIKALHQEQLLGFSQNYFFNINERKVKWKTLSSVNLENKSVVEEADGKLLMGLQKGKGIRRYQNIDQIRKGIYEPFLEGSSISHIFKDQAGGYWISSIEDGVFYCPDFDLKIYDQSSGFPIDYVAAFDFKNKNEIFAGFRNGQVVELNLNSNQISKLPAPPGNNIVYDILFDQSRNELLATTGQASIFKNGLWKVLQGNSQQGKKVHFISQKMTLGAANKMLWGTNHDGFSSLHLEQKKLMSNSNELGLSGRTLKVWEDQKKRIWIGNVNGLFEFKNDKLFTPEPFFEEFKTRVEDIGELSDGTLILGTKGEGILFWKGTTLNQLTTANGLTSDMLENIHVDGKGQIWAGSLEGLNKIGRKDKTFTIQTYTVSHGLPSNEITQVNTFEDQIWIATTKGLIHWKEKPPSNFSASPIIEKMMVNKQPLDLSKTIALSYTENNLEFHFLSINYKLSGKIPYRFRMNNGTWNNTFNRSVYFVKLPPGAYDFEVQSRNENGLWSISGNKHFTIQPPVWQTLWFKILLSALLAYIAWWFYRKRVGQIREETRIKHEMNELRSSALRSQMNPHFIFNCLNSIQNFIAQNDKANAAHYLARFAQLVRRALNASMDASVSLEEEINLLEDYLTLEQLRFKKKFDYTIEVDKQLHLFETEIPPMITQPFVENAIIHGMADKVSDGKIIVRFIKEEKKLIVEIEDNGAGIFEQKGKLKNNISHRSVGMKIPQDRLKLANPANKFEITEIRNTHHEVSGTLIRLILQQ